MVLTLAIALLIVIVVNGLGTFWPKPVTLVRFNNGSEVLGQRIKEDVNPDNGIQTVQYKTANRELTGMQDFHWYRADDIVETTRPEDVFLLERTGYGDFYGFLEKVDNPGLPAIEADAPAARLHEAIAAARAWKAAKIDPLEQQLGALSREANRLKHSIDAMAYRKQERLKDGASESSPGIAGLDEKAEELQNDRKHVLDESDGIRTEKLQHEAELLKNKAIFRVGSGQTHAVPLINIVRAYQPNAMGFFAKLGHYASKIKELLWAEPRESNTEGGLFPAIFGTVMLVFLMAIACFPLGVLAGIYLGEYARKGALVRLVRIAVNNLAGIPSIVYGIFGLGFFVYGVGGAIDRWFFPERAGVEPVFGTGGILWASLTLGLLTVPVVIVATEEALRTIPGGIREGSYALGATKFQTLYRVLLPMASPGVMTGFILAMARAAGEVAPLMLTGVIKIAPSLPLDSTPPYFHLDRKFMHLGFHIFDIAFQSPNVEASKPMVFVTTLLLVLIVLAMSSVAIYLRNRMRKRFQSRSI